LILLGDKYISPSLAGMLLPFGLANYRPLWAGLGQLGIDLSLLVTPTFYPPQEAGESALAGNPTLELWDLLTCHGTWIIWWDRYILVVGNRDIRHERGIGAFLDHLPDPYSAA